MPQTTLQELNRVPCPQCAALVSVPRRAEVVTCPACRSTLRPREGVRLFRAWQRVLVSPEQAEAAVRAWLAGPETPRGAEAAALPRVGELQWFPFLRLRGEGADRVEPLGAVPTPDVIELGSVPAAWLPEGQVPGEISADAWQTDPLARHGEAVTEMIRESDTLRELVVEFRAFYPVEYHCDGEPFGAVVDAGTGRVLAARKPAAGKAAGVRYLALVSGAVLFAEALLVPTLAAKLVAVFVTAGILYAAVLKLSLQRAGSPG